MARATAGFEAWDFTRSLEVTESFFWTFCDDYLELVKDRAYGGCGEAAAAKAPARALRLGSMSVRLLAPILPYATGADGRGGTRVDPPVASWPTVGMNPAGGDPSVLASVGAALAAVRKAKSEARSVCAGGHLDHLHRPSGGTR